MINTLGMLKLGLQLKAFSLFVIVLIGLITRIMIGYGGFTNPLHRHEGASMQAAACSIALDAETTFHTFKLKRKIALETVTNLSWYFINPAPMVNSILISRLNLVDDPVHPGEVTLRFRPPTAA